MNRADLLLLKAVLSLSERIAPFTFKASLLPDTLLKLYPFSIIRNCFIECIWCELIDTDEECFLPAHIPVIKGLTKDGYRFLHEYLSDQDSYESLSSKYEPLGTSTFNYYYSWVICDTPQSTAIQAAIADLIMNTRWNDVIYIGKKNRKNTPVSDITLAEIIFNYKLMVKNRLITRAELNLGYAPNIGKCRLSLRGDKWLNTFIERNYCNVFCPRDKRGN